MWQVSSTELNKLRGIKSGMNKLLSRVSKVKQELESILDDDGDMVVRPRAAFPHGHKITSSF